MSTQPQPLPAPSPVPSPVPIDRPGRNFLRYKRKYGIYDGTEIGPLLAELEAATSREEIVAGLLPARSVNLLVGESGIGKSPLAYQLGLAAAMGLPFLGMATRASKVLIVDYENSLAAAYAILEQQRRNLRVSEFPAELQLWPMSMRPDQEEVEEVIALFAPDLVIIDSLRSFNPAMEGDNATAVAQITRMRTIAAERGTAFLLVHHLNKRHSYQGRLRRPPLEEGGVMEWLLSSAGARALINQTDVRLAAESNGDGLLMRGHYRTRGEVGPIVARRTYHEGRPLGYERVFLHPRMIQNPRQEAAYAQLPDAFTFGEAEAALGQSRQSANVFLQKTIALGLIRKRGVSRYSKVFDVSPADSAQTELERELDTGVDR